MSKPLEYVSTGERQREVEDERKEMRREVNEGERGGKRDESKGGEEGKAGETRGGKEGKKEARWEGGETRDQKIKIKLLKIITTNHKNRSN